MKRREEADEETRSKKDETPEGGGERRVVASSSTNDVGGITNSIDGDECITVTNDDNNNDDDNVIAAFGEIVEDPILSMNESDICHDPTIIRDTIKLLNRKVIQGFLQLVHTLANDDDDDNDDDITSLTTTTTTTSAADTADNDTTTELLCNEVSNNIFLMLKECNKFRYHQACEILIRTLECQYERRKKGLLLIQREIDVANRALEELHLYQSSMEEETRGGGG